MPIDPKADIEITAFDWVPDFARGFVRDLRPRWACEELDLAYSERLISAMHRPEWYYAEQPFGQVPVLKDGDLRLFESGAILVHLAEREGRLLPATGQARAEVLGWLFASYNSIEPLAMELGGVLIFHAGKDWAEARKPLLLEEVDKKLGRLSDALGTREWIAGEFSIADIALVSTLREFERSEVFAKFPALVAYTERGTARAAFHRALNAQLTALADEPPIAA